MYDTARSGAKARSKIESNARDGIGFSKNVGQRSTASARLVLTNCVRTMSRARSEILKKEIDGPESEKSTNVRKKRFVNTRRMLSRRLKKSVSTENANEKHVIEKLAIVKSGGSVEQIAATSVVHGRFRPRMSRRAPRGESLISQANCLRVEFCLKRRQALAKPST